MSEYLAIDWRLIGDCLAIGWHKRMNNLVSQENLAIGWLLSGDRLAVGWRNSTAIKMQRTTYPKDM